MPEQRFEAGTPFTDSDIEVIEKALGKKLPEAYCNFVKEYGDAFVGGEVDGSNEYSVLGFHDVSDVLKDLAFHEDFEKDQILPIASCELGNLYVLYRENAIWHINYYGGTTTVSKVSESFEDFLSRIVVTDK